MPILLALQTLVTAIVALHIYRTGRPNYWIFIVMAFPVLGALAYVFFEVLPGSPEGVQLARGVRALHKRMDPTRDFVARAEEMERCGSVANRVDLARECIDLGHYAQAQALLASCLTAQFAQDREIRHLLAVAQYGAEQYDGAIETLQALLAEDRWYHGGDALLLLANALAAAGRPREADPVYKEAVERYAGEEARSDYIRFLVRDGRVREAQSEVDAMQRRVRLNGRLYERRQKSYIEAARTALSGAGAPR